MSVNGGCTDRWHPQLGPGNGICMVIFSLTFIHPQLVFADRSVRSRQDHICNQVWPLNERQQQGEAPLYHEESLSRDGAAVRSLTDILVTVTPSLLLEFLFCLVSFIRNTCTKSTGLGQAQNLVERHNQASIWGGNTIKINKLVMSDNSDRNQSSSVPLLPVTRSWIL